MEQSIQVDCQCLFRFCVESATLALPSPDQVPLLLLLPDHRPPRTTYAITRRQSRL